MPVPNHLQTVVPYLILKDANAFIKFTQELFHAETTALHFRDEAQHIVMHAELKIGNASLMCADATDEWTTQTAGLFIYVENADATFHKALQSGCSVVLELCDQAYGRTCGIQDAFGNTWWITSV